MELLWISIAGTGKDKIHMSSLKSQKKLPKLDNYCHMILYYQIKCSRYTSTPGRQIHSKPLPDNKLADPTKQVELVNGEKRVLGKQKLKRSRNNSVPAKDNQVDSTRKAPMNQLERKTLPNFESFLVEEEGSGNGISTGEDAFTFGDCQYVGDVGFDDLPTQMDVEEGNDILPGRTYSTGGQVQSSRKVSKKMKGPSDKIAQSLTCIAAVLGRMVQTLEQQSVSISRNEEKKAAYCRTIMTEMLKLEGIDRDSRIRAITLLHSNEVLGMLFMELPTDMRLDWIMSILHG